jgi:hypothetical protein
LASATDSNPESLTLDGVSQAALTVNVRSYATADTEATVFTGVEAVTVSGQSQINSANVTNTLGVVTANSASSATIRTSGSTISSANTGALTVDSLNANNALTVAVNAGAYDSLIVTKDVNATSGLVQTLDIDAAASAIINVDGGDFVLTGSSVRNAYIDLLADAQLYDNSDTNTVDIEATTIASLAMNLGANSKIGLDLDTAVTSGTVAMSSGSQWHVNTIGGAGAVTSITVTGTGDVDSGKTGGVIAPGITLIGSTVTFNASGLTDADSLSIASTATTKATISLPLTATGAGEISSGAGADSLTGGNGADRFGVTGHTETITLTYADTETYAYSANGVGTGTLTMGTNMATSATALANAINATSATSFATAVTDGSTGASSVITVTYSQWFGTLGSTSGTNAARAVVAQGAAGDNAGADTITGGAGVDTIIGGTGADVMDGGLGNDSYLQISATDTGFVAAAASISTATLDKITANAGDTIKLFLQTPANYDVLGTLATATTITNTTTTTAIARSQGVYDATAQTFTIGATGANAVLISYSTTNAGTTADQQIVITGVTNVTSITDGIITV